MFSVLELSYLFILYSWPGDIVNLPKDFTLIHFFSSAPKL